MRNRCSGSIGARARASRAMKAARPRSPTAAAASTGAEPPPRVGASISANTIPARPSVAAAAPATSTGPSPASPRLSGTLATQASNSTTPIGTLSRKAQRHEKWSTRKPPTTGPIAAVMPLNADQVPIARPRSASGKLAPSSARLPGTSSAAPMPCSARAAINCPVSCAAAQAADVATNTATPSRNTRLRPKRSPSAPPTSNNAARNSAYASMIHCASAPLASRLRWIAGSATLTTVPSMKAMLEPSTALTSVQRRTPAVVVSTVSGGVARRGMRAFSASRRSPVRRPWPGAVYFQQKRVSAWLCLRTSASLASISGCASNSRLCADASRSLFTASTSAALRSSDCAGRSL